MPKPGRYRIARKIADGGMAEIFLGTQHGMEGFERPVVLKRILAPLVADPQFRNMLIDEAHVAMGLNHSNIVQVLDLGHVRGRYFLVMELVDGWDLSRIMSRAEAAHFPVPPEILLYITAEVCRALAYAHARTRDGRPLHIVHRDVSPQNVLVSEQGEVKLTDFGIAKAMGRREQTSQGVIKGKLAFMSPEQASGRPLDPRSDLFAVGTMLYLFFTGRKPFYAPTDLESIMRVRECRFTPPEEVDPTLAPALVKVIHRAMQALPADRYQSADELLVDLENVQRTSYKPSGQTELKRWLAELQERDHCPVTSRVLSPQPAVPLTQDLDVGEGAEVVFDDSNLIDVSDVLRQMQVAEPTTPAPAPPPILGSDGKTKAATPASLRTARSSRSSKPAILFGILIVGLAAGVAWFVRQHAPGPPVKTGHPRAASIVIDAAQALRPAPVDAVFSLALEAGQPEAGEPAATPASEAADNEEEEESLLRNAEPEDSKRVLGEDEGVSAREGAAAAESAAPPAVSVRLVSSPKGAVVKVGKRVFGRAPLSLRFRPGITFEIDFVKKGYLPASKRFAVSEKKNQVVKVTLKKKPKKKTAEKKSFFRRIFGR